MIEYPPEAGYGRPIDLGSTKTVGQRGRHGVSYRYGLVPTVSPVAERVLLLPSNSQSEAYTITSARCRLLMFAPTRVKTGGSLTSEVVGGVAVRSAGG